MHMPEYDNSSNNVVVIGLGPIGLAAAIEACQAGLNVTAITDRPLGKQKGGYTRKPILRLNETSFEYLESLVGKNAVHAYLAKNKLEEFQFKQMNFNKNTTEIVTYYFISVHDLENLLYEKLEKILAWTKLVLRTILPPDKVETLTPKQYKNKKDVYQQEKQRKQITTFEVDLQQTNQAIVRLPQIPPSSENAYFLPVGDALHTPHYHLGTGVNDGLLQTKLLHELFKNKNIATYQLGVEKILAASNIRIQTYLDSRQKREDLATATKRQAASIKQFVTQLSTPFYEKRGPISKSFSPKKPKR